MTENNFRKDVFEHLKKEKERAQADIVNIQTFKDEFYQSRGSKFIKQSSFVLLEIIVWALVVAELFWLIFLFRVPPLHKFQEMLVHVKNTGFYAADDLNIVEWSVRGLVILIIIATFFVARMVSALRKQNSRAVHAGKGFMDLIDVENARLKDINDLEQKYVYLNAEDINIELENFTNPLMPPPPQGDELLD